MNPGLRTFYTILFTQTLSLIGSRISSLALGIYIYQQTGSATPLALVAFFGTLPFVLVSNLAGWMADRYDRRYVMALADLGQAAATLLLFGIFLGGGFQLWHLYLLTALSSLFGAFQSPAFSASVTMLVPDAERDRANTIRQASGPVAGIIAPVLAAAIYSLGGVILAILVDFFSFTLAIVVILRVTIPRPERSEESRKAEVSLLREILAGLHFLWQRRPLLALVLYIALISVFFAAASVLLTPYILGRTGSEMLYGLLMGALQLGGVIGAVAFGVWGVRGSRMRAILLGLLACSLMLAVVGMAQHPVLLALSLFLLMMPLPMVNALLVSLLQLKVVPDMQGRVFALVDQLTTLLVPLTYLIVGPLADQVFEPLTQGSTWDGWAPLVGRGAGAGIGLMFVAASGALVLMTLVAWTVPALRTLEARLPDYVAEKRDAVAPL